MSATKRVIFSQCGKDESVPGYKNYIGSVDEVKALAKSPDDFDGSLAELNDVVESLEDGRKVGVQVLALQQ